MTPKLCITPAMKLLTIALAIACVAQLGAQDSPTFRSVDPADLAKSESPEDEVRIEILSDKELAELKAAKKAFAEAQAKLDAIKTAIKQGHGEKANGYPGDAMIHCRITKVEIRGTFAIVTKMPDHCTGTHWLSIR